MPVKERALKGLTDHSTHCWDVASIDFSSDLSIELTLLRVADVSPFTFG